MVAGQTELAPLLRARIPEFSTSIDDLALDFDDAAHPTATRMRLTAPDRIGLLYLVSHTLSALGCNIEMAYVATAGGSAQDEFYVTRDGGRLTQQDQAALRTALYERTTPRDPAARAAESCESTSALRGSSRRSA